MENISLLILPISRSQLSVAHSCTADVWPALFSYSTGLSGQAARHSCCPSTPHHVLHWDRGNSPSADSSEQAHHDACPELGTTWVPLLHPSPPHFISPVKTVSLRPPEVLRPPGREATQPFWGQGLKTLAQGQHWWWGEGTCAIPPAWDPSCRTRSQWLRA